MQKGLQATDVRIFLESANTYKAASGRGHLNVVLDNCRNRQSAKLSLRGKFTKFTAAMLTWDVILEIWKMLNPGLRDCSSFSEVSNMKYK